MKPGTAGNRETITVRSSFITNYHHRLDLVFRPQFENVEEELNTACTRTLTTESKEEG